MAVTESGTLCANHSGTLAVAACDRCGKPVCAICRFEDVSADAVYYSSACRDVVRGEAAGLPRISDADLAEGYERPIVTGWKLWARALPALVLHTAPLALLMGLIIGAIPEPKPEETEPSMQDVIAILGVLAALGYGVALIQVVLSQRYTGLVRGNPFLWTLRRFFPWAVASAIAVAATLLGYLLFVIPGIILALRLFWADEFALVHGAG